jgi:hypothetical protein
MLSSRGPPAAVLNLVINVSISIVLDTRIFDEYDAILYRKTFAFPVDAGGEILHFIKKEGIFIPQGRLPVRSRTRVISPLSKSPSPHGCP